MTARSNGFVVNAQIIKPRSLSRLTSASASAPIALAPLVTVRRTAEPHFESRVPRDNRIQIRRRKGDRLLAFLQADKGLTTAPQLLCLTVTGSRTSGLHCSYPWLLAACCWPTIVSTACSPHTTTSACTHIQTNTRRALWVDRARRLLAAVADILHAHHIHTYRTLPCKCNMQYAVPREAKRAYSSRMQIGHICHVDMCIRCRPLREISQASRTWHDIGMASQKEKKTAMPCQADLA